MSISISSFEYRSGASWLGLPLVHVAWGRNPASGRLRVARGWLAVGQFAIGPVVVAQFGLGLVGVGQFAAGLLVAGQFVLAVLAGAGQFAAGPVAAGQFGAGLMVRATLAGAGSHVWAGSRQDAEAVRYFNRLSRGIWPGMPWPREAAAVGPELVRNGGFEGRWPDRRAWDVLDGGERGSVAGLDPRLRAQGRWSFFCAATRPTARPQRYVQRVDLPAADCLYEFTGRILVSGPGQGAVRLSLRPERGGSARTWQLRPGPAPAGKWTGLRQRFYARSDDDGLEIQLMQVGEGQVWFDALSLRRLAD